MATFTAGSGWLELRSTVTSGGDGIGGGEVYKLQRRRGVLRAYSQSMPPPAPLPPLLRGPKVGGGEGTPYTVEKGDTLYAIAKRHHVSMQTIAEANGKVLKRGVLLRVGEVLRIPGREVAAAAAAAAPASAGSRAGRAAGWRHVYEVQQGDTAAAVARKLGLSLDEFRQLAKIERSPSQQARQLRALVCVPCEEAETEQHRHMSPASARQVIRQAPALAAGPMATMSSTPPPAQLARLAGGSPLLSPGSFLLVPLALAALAAAPFLLSCTVKSALAAASFLGHAVMSLVQSLGAIWQRANGLLARGLAGGGGLPQQYVPSAGTPHFIGWQRTVPWRGARTVAVRTAHRPPRGSSLGGAFGRMEA